MPRHYSAQYNLYYFSMHYWHPLLINFHDNIIVQAQNLVKQNKIVFHEFKSLIRQLVSPEQ